MPCVLGCLALVAPRLTIFLVWIFSEVIETACETTIWPVLGFVFMPFTTLAYALAWHMAPRGSIAGFGLVIVVVAVLMDLGVIGGGARDERVRKGVHFRVGGRTVYRNER